MSFQETPERISLSGTNQRPQIFHIPRLLQIHQMVGLGGTKARIKLQYTLDFRPVIVISRGPVCSFTQVDFQRPDQTSRMSFPPEILPARWNAPTAHLSPLLVGGCGGWRLWSVLTLRQPTLAPRRCAKSNMKCESRRRSERAINTPSPCALTNTPLDNLLL